MHVREERWHGSRREVLSGSARLGAGGLLGVALTRCSVGRVLAQATPETPPYPELTVTITDVAFELSTTEVSAGYVLLTAVNQTSAPSGAGLIGPGPGQTMQDLLQAAAAATPQAENVFPPSFFYPATLPGGPNDVPPGGTKQAVIQLSAGDWAVWGGSETSNQPPAFLTATAGGSATQSAPTATVTITEVDFAFGGFGQSIQPGQQTWQVINQGTQPHMLGLSQVQAGTTLAQVMEALGGSDNATPSAGQLQREDFVGRGGVILQSPGTTVWPMLDLPAGRYAAVCFVADPMHGGMPHAMEGMIAVFDIGEPSS